MKGTFDIDAETKGGVTPLMLAVKVGNITTVEALLNAGADPWKKDKTGVEVIDYAKSINRNEMQSYPITELITSAKQNNPRSNKDDQTSDTKSPLEANSED